MRETIDHIRIRDDRHIKEKGKPKMYEKNMLSDNQSILKVGSANTHTGWRKIGKRLLLRVLPLLVVFSIFAFLEPAFRSEENIINLLRQSSTNTIIAFGMTFVILAGGIDLSVGSVLALTSVIAADLQVKGMGIWPTVLIPIVIAAIAGLFSGLLVAKARLQPFIATLSTMFLYRGAAYVYSQGQSIWGLSDEFGIIGRGYIKGVPIPVIITLFTFLVCHFILSYTRFGRRIYIVGGNKRAADLFGMKTDRYVISTFIISGILAGVGGVIYASRLGSGQPAGGFGFELNAIAAVLIGGVSFVGGRGDLICAFLGALMIGVFLNGLNLLGVGAYWQPLTIGAVILSAMLIDRVRYGASTR